MAMSQAGRQAAACRTAQPNGVGEVKQLLTAWNVNGFLKTECLRPYSPVFIPPSVVGWFGSMFKVHKITENC